MTPVGPLVGHDQTATGGIPPSLEGAKPTDIPEVERAKIAAMELDSTQTRIRGLRAHLEALNPQDQPAQGNSIG